MYALIIDNTVNEISSRDPSGRYHPSLDWRKCSDEVCVGWSVENGVFSPPQGPAQEELAERRRQEIKRALSAIDEATTRPLRAILAGSGNDEDQERLIELDAQAKELRAALNDLEN